VTDCVVVARLAPTAHDTLSETLTPDFTPNFERKVVAVIVVEIAPSAATANPKLGLGLQSH